MFSYSKFEHDYTKSYFKYREPVSEDYRVFVNGEEIPVYTCRISKYPFNRVWPGYQRAAEQSEPASFVNIVSDEEIKIEVLINRSYQRILLKPYSKNIDFSDESGKISFSLNEPGQFVLEADNYHHCLYIFNSLPVKKPARKEVTYYFGPGVHMPGKIVLKDGESVYADKDALIFGCIYAEKAKNIKIFGNGLFDDRGEGRIDNSCYEEFTNGNIKLYECENVKIDGVLFRDSAIWCVNIFNCSNVEIDNIKVFGQWRYNTDGIDIVNSSDVLIRNSFIHSFDDTITIKGIDRYIKTDNKNMLVEGCVLWCDWGRVCEIGIETACREYKNIIFRDCDIIRSGTAALDIQNGDCAEISDIVFENIRVEYNSFDTPEVYQKSDDFCYNKEDSVHIPVLFSIRNHRFRTEENCRLWGIPLELKGIVDLCGIASGGVHSITVRNINVYYDENMPLRENKPDIRMDLVSELGDIEYYNINISDIKVNGKKLKNDDVFFTVKGVKDYSFSE